MRITEGMIANTILSNLQLGQNRLEKLQQQASSGYKVNTPGDDPVSTQQILQLKRLLQDNDQYSRNITIGRSWLEQSDSSMSDMGNVVTRAREIAVQMANGTYTAQDRATAVSELSQLKNELVQLGNSQVAGKYIFGGFVSDTPPFDPSSGAYIGTSDAFNMEVDRGAYVTINVSGGPLLRGGTPPGSTGTDIIGTLDALASSLNSNDVTGIKNALPALQNALSQLLGTRGDVGARMNRLQVASDKLDSVKLSLNKILSAKQDVDALQVFSDLSIQQTAFQAALAASAKTSQMSLLDYLK